MTVTRSLYLVHRGATLARAGEHLVLRARGEKPTEIQIHGLRQLVLVGGIAPTPRAVEALLDHGIDTVLLTRTGRYLGRLVGGPSSAVALRLAQYRAIDDAGRALALARAIVIAKLRAQRVLLLRHLRRHGHDDALSVAARSLRFSVARAERASSLDELRGCEGAGAAAYFRAFGRLLRTQDFQFDGRNRRPPLDPVNALLSLGYTLLTTAVEGALAVVGLDPYVGTLHAPLSGRPSLACDLVEEHRVPVVDSLVVAAINKGAFRPEDFEECGPGEPVILRREALRWMVTLFERRMERPVFHAPSGRRLPYREVVLQQCRAFARAVEEGTEYVPFESR
jgi:CRISPR-associated protein Cas1